MNYQHHHDLPGYGDVLRPHGVDHDAAIAAIASVLFDECMASESFVGEIQGFLSDGEYTAINRAIIDGDDMEAGRQLRLGVIRATREYSAKEAEMRYRKVRRADLRDWIEREDEHDYAMERMEG